MSKLPNPAQPPSIMQAYGLIPGYHKNVLTKMSKLPNPAQPPSIMQAYGLIPGYHKNVLTKMSKLPNPAQPPSIMQAYELARYHKNVLKNEQAAQSSPTSRHNSSILASPGTKWAECLHQCGRYSGYRLSQLN